MSDDGVAQPAGAGRDGGPADAVAVWEAQTEYAIGVLIRRYLAESPAPGRSQIARDFQDWAHALAADGRARLEELGAGHLRPVRPPGRR
ncbi:MAG: hypothetical protein JWR30_222 [Conexibacter sp.]|nr:hypothetical protein [Conexibacter sp.]